LTYGIGERSIMIALMALNRAVPNAELDKKYKLNLKKAQRERLNRDGLVASENVPKIGYMHELTDKGWAWVTKELSAAAPARAGSAGGALYALLNGIEKALERRDMRLAEFFAATANAARESGEPKAKPLAIQIRHAYRKLAKRSRDWVSLRELRPLLNGAHKTEIDNALKEMFTARDINLTLEEDQKRLTAEDRAAAIRIGRDDLHFISME
jgi:hypothetical protein